MAFRHFGVLEMELFVNRAINIVMIFVWLIAQTMVASHAQAHASMNHGSMMAPVQALMSESHDHAGHKMHQSSAAQHDMTHKTGDSSSMSDDCCEVPCQFAQACELQVFGTMLPAASPASVYLATAIAWSPGSQNPPPNPAI